MIKNSILFAVAVAAIAVLPSCSKKSDSPSNNASLMFVHGCASGTGSLTLAGEINGVKVNGATNLQFLSNSGYQSVTAGNSIVLSFFVVGLNQLTAQTVSLTANTHYTAFASGGITTPGITFATDDLTAPASGMAKVRFVNLSPDNLNTDCFVGTTKVDSGVGYGTCTPFFNVAVATGKVAMFDHTTPTESGQITSQSLAAGKIYTFMLTGTSAGSGTATYTLTAINNN